MCMNYERTLIVSGTNFLFYIALFVFSFSSAYASTRTVNLVVSYKEVFFAGKKRLAIAVNNQIPAPTLRFSEGDQVTINLTNKLDKPTAVHWHGLLVPWQMDGVAGISQEGIKPGHTFHYQFTLHQSGTYWYHAHAGLQEQQGLYGALIIDPRHSSVPHYTKDYVIVLSDWSNTYPDQILANLKKDGDYYSPRFPLQPSLMKFIHDYQFASGHDRSQLIHDYQMMQQMRMGIYDINDVAYDTFLLNGRTSKNPWTAPVRVGDIVRLRFIGAGGSTMFHVKMPNAMMQMIEADGNNVLPYPIRDFSIAPGETFDVLVKIKTNNPTIIYAESADTVGASCGALITSPSQPVNCRSVTPFPEPLPVTREMMSHTTHMHHEMKMPTEPTIIGDTFSSNHHTHAMTTPDTKYQPITAAVKTNDPTKPIASVINMELFGYMDRFIWFINGVPEYNAKPLVFEPSKRYRLVFKNTSMMHHPMHIHGHWFILREGKGAYDPLLHTIDVPPGATIVADVDTDASGQWLFHCHFLYHMMAGMSRVVQYSTLIDIVHNEAKPQHQIQSTRYHNRPIVSVDEVRPINHELVKHPMAHLSQFWFASFLELSMNPFQNTQKFTYKGLYGPDWNKLELLIEDAERVKGQIEDADIDIFYWHLLSQFWAIKGGVNYTYRPSRTPYWQPGIGIEGLMPYFIDTNVRSYFRSGSVKLDVELARDTQITNNFFMRLGLRSILATKSVTRAEIGSGLNQMRYTLRPYYRVMPGINAFLEYEYEQDYGAFKRFETQGGEASSQNTMTLGLSFLF
jgi:FtsP/CotA-like multicopper oxidase with cupredoxin domain/uncharacterized protein involved in copper resistance